MCLSAWEEGGQEESLSRRKRSESVDLQRLERHTILDHRLTCRREWRNNGIQLYPLAGNHSTDLVAKVKAKRGDCGYPSFRYPAAGTTPYSQSRLGLSSLVMGQAFILEGYIRMGDPSPPLVGDSKSWLRWFRGHGFLQTMTSLTNTCRMKHYSTNTR